MTFDQFLLEAEKAIVSKAQNPAQAADMVRSFDTSMVGGGSTDDVRRSFFQKLLHNISVQRYDVYSEERYPQPSWDAKRTVLDQAIRAIRTKLQELEN